MDLYSVVEILTPFMGILGFCVILWVQAQTEKYEKRAQTMRDELEQKFDRMNREAEYESINAPEELSDVIDVPNLAEDQ